MRVNGRIVIYGNRIYVELFSSSSKFLPTYEKLLRFVKSFEDRYFGVGRLSLGLDLDLVKGECGVAPLTVNELSTTDCEQATPGK